MSIIVKTKNPNTLVAKIKEYIDEKKIDTWIYDSDGDFTHNVVQWEFHAWLRPIIPDENTIIFAIIGRNDKKMSVVEYAVYHGRFIEMLLSHFDKQCQSMEATPLPTKHDDLGKEVSNEG